MLDKLEHNYYIRQDSDKSIATYLLTFYDRGVNFLVPPDGNTKEGVDYACDSTNRVAYSAPITKTLLYKSVRDESWKGKRPLSLLLNVRIRVLEEAVGVVFSYSILNCSQGVFEDSFGACNSSVIPNALYLLAANRHRLLNIEHCIRYDANLEEEKVTLYNLLTERHRNQISDDIAEKPGIVRVQYLSEGVEREIYKTGFVDDVVELIVRAVSSLQLAWSQGVNLKTYVEEEQRAKT